MSKMSVSFTNPVLVQLDPLDIGMKLHNVKSQEMASSSQLATV